MSQELDYQIIRCNAQLKMLQQAVNDDDKMYYASEVWNLIKSDHEHFLKKDMGDVVYRILRFLAKSSRFHPMVNSWISEWNDILLSWLNKHYDVSVIQDDSTDDDSLNDHEYDEREDEYEDNVCCTCEVHGHQLWSLNDYNCDLCNAEDNLCNYPTRKRRRKCGLVKQSQQPEIKIFQI